MAANTSRREMLIDTSTLDDRPDRQTGVVLADADRGAFRELVATGRTPIPAELAATVNVWEPEDIARRLFDRVKRKRDRERARHSVAFLGPFGSE
jgi:hypothetical protein